MPVNQIIAQLTPEQQALIPVYKEKWRKIARSTERIDKEKAESAVKAMICPSTGHIHFLRVPPDLNSARKAIGWVNWGVEPQEFAVQT